MLTSPVVTAVEWPAYSVEEPQNIVFDANVTALAHAEPDNYREVQIEYLMEKLFGNDSMTEM